MLSSVSTIPAVSASTQGQQDLRWQRHPRGSRPFVPARPTPSLLRHSRPRSKAAPKAQPLSLSPQPVKLRRQLPEQPRQSADRIPPFCRANPRAQSRALLT